MKKKVFVGIIILVAAAVITTVIFSNNFEPVEKLIEIGIVLVVTLPLIFLALRKKPEGDHPFIPFRIPFFIEAIVGMGLAFFIFFLAMLATVDLRNPEEAVITQAIGGFISLAILYFTFKRWQKLRRRPPQP